MSGPHHDPETQDVQAATLEIENPAGDQGGETWVVLLHTPGPSAPHDGTLFQAPGFAKHVAFLQLMRQAGYLVAAGPLPDADGAGMTVLRLPGPDRFEEAHRLATQDDVSVASGFFTCQVRHWQVMLTPEADDPR